jgi:hypothetical protein
MAFSRSVHARKVAKDCPDANVALDAAVFVVGIARFPFVTGANARGVWSNFGTFVMVGGGMFLADGSHESRRFKGGNGCSILR